MGTLFLPADYLHFRILQRIEKMDTLTVLIADDHPVFRKGLRALLASMPEV